MTSRAGVLAGSLFVVVSGGCDDLACACQPSIDLLQLCVEVGTCELDGVVVDDCNPNGGDCPLGSLERGVVLTIPLEDVRMRLGARDDFIVSYADVHTVRPNIEEAEITLDGASLDCPLAGNVRWCRDVPLSASSFEIRYDDEDPGADFIVRIFASDETCRSAYGDKSGECYPDDPSGVISH